MARIGRTKVALAYKQCRGATLEKHAVSLISAIRLGRIGKRTAHIAPLPANCHLFRVAKLHSLLTLNTFSLNQFIALHPTKHA